MAAFPKRSSILLMDGIDLMSVLEGQIDFVSLIVLHVRVVFPTPPLLLNIAIVNKVKHHLSKILIVFKIATAKIDVSRDVIIYPTDTSICVKRIFPIPQIINF